MGIPYYITFNRYNDEFQAFQLVASRYQAMQITAGRLWIPDLEVGLGLWLGEYRGARRQWLRWYDKQSNWIPTEVERVEQAKQQAEQERQRALSSQQLLEQERRLREELIARLRERGIELNHI